MVTDSSNMEGGGRERHRLGSSWVLTGSEGWRWQRKLRDG
jgi:hypothetical protein